MSNTIAYVDNQTLTNIADAVRYKTGTNGKMLLSDIPDKIRNIEGIVPSGSIEVTENGTYDVTTKQTVFVNVPSQAPVLDSLSVTANGTYTPASGTDGFDEVVVNIPTGEETWDGTLYPITDETDPIYESKPFDAHWVQLSAGDTIIIEGYGRGRWVGFRGITTTSISSLPATINIAVRSAPQFDYLRFRFDVVEDCIAVLASSSGSKEGTHSGQVGYCFCGEYLKWKVIHAS